MDEFTGSGVRSIINKVGAEPYVGSYGLGFAESSTYSSEGCWWKTGFQAARVRLLAQVHSDTPTPTRPYLLIVTFLWSQHGQIITTFLNDLHPGAINAIYKCG